MKSYDVKITTKLIITIIISGMFGMLLFEMAYCHLMYKDYKQIYDEVYQMQERVDKLIEINLDLQKYILKYNTKGES